MINLLEKQQQIESIIGYSQGYNFELNCQEIIQKWEAAKQRFINWIFTMTNGESSTIYRFPKPVNISLPIEERYELLEDLLKELLDNDLLYKKDYYGYLLEEFLNKNYSDCLLENQISKFFIGDIKSNMKLTKAVKYFFDSLSDVRKTQDIISKYVQIAHIEGWLYLSVDPIDFLTSSENNSNWRSCHALNGEHRAGNISYMLDKTTAMVYLASDKKERLKNVPCSNWYNKHWRMLLHINPEDHIVFFGRQYPFESDSLLGVIKDTLFSSTYDYRIYDDSFRSISEINVELPVNFFCINNHLLSSKDLCKGSKNALNYNDIIYSTCYKPSFIVNPNLLSQTRHLRSYLRTPIGANVPCACGCGNIVTDTSSFICEECENKESSPSVEAVVEGPF